MQLNPIYFFVDGVRKCLYEHQVPGLNSWLIMLGIAGGSLLVGYLVFKKLQKNFISFY